MRDAINLMTWTAEPYTFTAMATPDHSYVATASMPRPYTLSRDEDYTGAATTIDARAAGAWSQIVAGITLAQSGGWTTRSIGGIPFSLVSVRSRLVEPWSPEASIPANGAAQRSWGGGVACVQPQFYDVRTRTLGGASMDLYYMADLLTDHNTWSMNGNPAVPSPSGFSFSAAGVTGSVGEGMIVKLGTAGWSQHAHPATAMGSALSFPSYPGSFTYENPLPNNTVYLETSWTAALPTCVLKWSMGHGPAGV